jgi:pimeloyl-ACP methyl ester carboxylesterase
MPILERQGARIFYETEGQGPAILLGHSLLCDNRMWEGVAPELARTHRVININVRGHGGSTAPHPFTLEDLAGDWLAILDREGIESAVLCGLSMGAMTALRVALAAPERVRGLILLDTSADPEVPPKRIQYAAMIELVRAFGHIDFIYKIVKRIMFSETTLRERPWIAQREIYRMKEKDAHQLYHAVHAVFDRGTVLDRVPQINAPALVMVGADDVATPPIRSERLAAALPNARLHVIPGAGHLSALEAPSAVIREISEFLSLLESKSRG